MSEEPFTVDRRTTLQWMFGAIAAAGVPLPGTAAAAARALPQWPETNPALAARAGYGTDPAMLEAVVPWPKTLSAPQRATVAVLCDTILPAEGDHPAPSAIGIHDFIDEWVSAPYPEQAGDRVLLLSGIEWIEREAKQRHGKAYPALAEAQCAAILWDAAGAGADGQGAAFFTRLKYLTCGAYYTSEAGIAELGYVGNEALSGDYPGPTPEALAHLDQLLGTLNLKRT